MKRGRRLPGRILLNHDGKKFYCWRFERWFDELKLNQCWARGCLWMYEHMAGWKGYSPDCQRADKARRRDRGRASHAGA